MILSSLPIRIVDLTGSILMIIFSFMCLRLVSELKKHEQSNVIWTYLLWVCWALAVFAISRSAGHILKQILFFSGNESIWNSIRPFSGAVNTFMFMVVAPVTLFFERSWKIYQQILKDKQALQSAHEELFYLNQNLERRVIERTEALARSEHKYRRIFEISRDIILVANKNGVIIDLNPVGYKLLGYNDADILPNGNRFQDFFLKKDDWDAIKDTIEKQGFISNAEVDLKRIDGINMRSLISGSLDKAPPNEEDTIHFLIKDIEQIRLMEKQMAQADKLASIGQFSAGIAHEINNPMGIILGYTQLLLRNEDPDTDRYKDLKTIEKHVRNCKGIVEDLLNFARSSKPEKEVINIHETIDDVLNFIQHHSELDNVEIVRDYDKKVPHMLLDEKKIKQVLINLIMNAKHAVGRKGSIRLITGFKALSNQVTIKVMDTGYGIEKKNLERIFDPFFTTKRTGEGTGLGLSVSYGIIKNHGGDIFVESIPGKGSTFTVALPVIS